MQVRGRLSQGRGPALEFWQAAATVALENCVPLLAFCVGCDCGGEEGEFMVEASCQAMGRPRDVFMMEYADVTQDVTKPPSSSSSLARSWSRRNRHFLPFVQVPSSVQDVHTDLS